MFLQARSIFLFIVFSVILFYPLLSQGDTGAIFIDPQDPTLIRRTQVPFASQVVLKAQDLPQSSSLHEGVAFGEQKFTYLAVSPDHSRLAISVDGGQHDWSGIYSLKDKSLKQLTLCFESKAKTPYWSKGGRFLAVEGEGGRDQTYLEIFDLESETQCRLDGRTAKNKFLNFSKPWWNQEENKIYFRVEYNNAYRKSLGLKPKKPRAQIGEAAAHCKKIEFYSVVDFMKKFPEESQLSGIPMEDTMEDKALTQGDKENP